MIYEEVCKISSDMCHQIREKVISDILDYIIHTVHHNMKYFKQIFQKNSSCLNSQKKIETFCIYNAVKVFLKPLPRVYTINFQTNVSAKLLEFLNVNITLPLLFCFRMKHKINVIFFDQLNNIDLLAALPHFFHSPVATNSLLNTTITS